MSGRGSIHLLLPCTYDLLTDIENRRLKQSWRKLNIIDELKEYHLIHGDTILNDMINLGGMKHPLDICAHWNCEECFNYILSLHGNSILM